MIPSATYWTPCWMRSILMRASCGMAAAGSQAHINPARIWPLRHNSRFPKCMRTTLVRERSRSTQNTQLNNFYTLLIFMGAVIAREARKHRYRSIAGAPHPCILLFLSHSLNAECYQAAGLHMARERDSSLGRQQSPHCLRTGRPSTWGSGRTPLAPA